MNTTDGDASCIYRRKKGDGRISALGFSTRRAGIDYHLEEAHDAGLVDVLAAVAGVGAGGARQPGGGREEEERRCGGGGGGSAACGGEGW